MPGAQVLRQVVCAAGSEIVVLLDLGVEVVRNGLNVLQPSRAVGKSNALAVEAKQPHAWQACISSTILSVFAICSSCCKVCRVEQLFAVDSQAREAILHPGNGLHEH